MPISSSMVAELRRMTAEPTAATYSDETLMSYISRYPVLDERGELPYLFMPLPNLQGGMPPTKIANPIWIESYDLAAAAGDVWSEKAAALSEDYDTDADGASLRRSQPYDHAMQQARYWRSRRKATTIHVVPSPKPSDDPLWLAQAEDVP